MLVTLALASSLAGAAHGQAPGQALEKKQLTLAVGGKTALYYLPLTICERLGYFKEQGLDVTINDFRGGAQSLQALVGGSVDVVTGAYEHTIRMQAKGQDIKAVIELGRFPGIVVGVRKEKAASYKSAADLQGHEDRRERARLLHQFLRDVPDVEGGPQAGRRVLYRRRHRPLGRRRHEEGRDRRHLQPRSR